LKNDALCLFEEERTVLSRFFCTTGRIYPCVLVAAINKHNEFLVNHVDKTVLMAQAQAMGLPVVFAKTTWKTCEAVLLDALKQVKFQHDLMHVVGVSKQINYAFST
jgi:hypothetical protein